jgi:hypothetical protein
MITEESLATLRSMADGRADSAPIWADLLRRVSDDMVSRGPISALIGGHEDALEPLFCIRALAAVRFLMLSGKAPELADHLAGSAVQRRL